MRNYLTKNLADAASNRCLQWPRCDISPRTRGTTSLWSPIVDVAPKPLGWDLRRLPRVLSSNPGNLDSVNLGPNWFASVMGTGIIANASATLPVIGGYLRGFALVVWVVAASLLILLTVAQIAQWISKPSIAKSHWNDPVMAQFYGAPPMAMLTVGTGAMIVGHDLIGQTAADWIAWILWIAGTITGLLTAIVIPFRLFTKFQIRPDGAFGGWLMPVVPPMVSATGAAFLLPTISSQVWGETLLYASYAMFGMSFFASLIIITMIWSRLAHFGSTGSVRVPTLWIVLGPLGQSITAAGLLGTAALTTLAAPLSIAFNAASVIYGIPVWGFAIMWACIAGMLTVRTMRRKLPFALTWWSFTFPVGTVVTGTTQLAKHTQLPAFEVLAIAFFCCLLGAWVAVALKTLRGVYRTDLLVPPKTPPNMVARKDGDPIV